MKRPKKRGPVTFKVYPDPDRPSFFEVRVYRTLGAMRGALTRAGVRDNVHTWACVTPWVRDSYKKGRAPVRLPDIGRIYLARRCGSIEVIAHESTHAGAHWERICARGTCNLGSNDHDSRREERMAYAVGRIASQIGAELYKRRL